MNQSFSSDDIVTLTRQVAAMYYQEEPPQTFGAWVLSKFYHSVDTWSLASAHDFACAQRTVDARYYLGGMLRSGSLDAEPLRQAVANTAIEPRALAMVI